MPEAPAFTLHPVDRVRKMIAARMVNAKQSIPHFRIFEEVEVDALLALKTELAARPTPRISLNDLIVKACAAALTIVPEVNAQWLDEGIRRFDNADISVVMALSRGLSTPIVTDANLKSVWEIAETLAGLAERAEASRLRLEEIVGGSFTVSNLGMLGVHSFDAIINAPQCAILAVGSARKKWLVTDDGLPRVATCVCLTLSVDHRAIDGVAAARFIGVLKSVIETPAPLAVQSGAMA